MQAQEFYTEFISREDQMKALKDEMTAMLESFASSNNLSKKGIKKGIKEYKEYLKDQAEFTVVDHDADKVFEALSSGAA